MQAYSDDLRQRVVQACDDGILSRKEIAQHFDVSTAWVRRLLQRRRETGSISPLCGKTGPKPKVTAAQRERLAELVRKHPDATLAELKRKARLTCSVPTIHRVLKSLGLSLKKKSLRASEQDRDDVKRARKSWPYRLGHRNKQRLFYLDESGAQTNMIRNYGRSPRGERLVGCAPGGHWASLTMVCAILVDRVVAPMVIEGAMNSWIFQGYVKWLLVPQLQPGDTVILDNLACHKSAAVKNAVEGAGAKLMFLPPYSPDLNPIENMWSKVKAQLRSEGKRTKRTLTNAIGRALKAVTPSDCRGFFSHAGIATET